jgi:hypothetical protein
MFSALRAASPDYGIPLSINQTGRTEKYEIATRRSHLWRES